MQECSIRGACELLRISWDEADGIKRRAVTRGLARKIPVVMPRLFADEKGWATGTSSRENQSAFMFASEAGYTVADVWATPRLGVEFDHASGSAVSRNGSRNRRWATTQSRYIGRMQDTRSSPCHRRTIGKWIGGRSPDAASNRSWCQRIFGCLWSQTRRRIELRSI